MVSKPIYLPDTDPNVFQMLLEWVYQSQPPVTTREEDLLLLMKLWVTAGKIGFWRQQNTIMRLGMALMQPKEFKCNIETVRWVYEHTERKQRKDEPEEKESPLRPYIMAIFCQRPPAITPEFFSSDNAQIIRDALRFFRVLSWIRAGNPNGKEGYVLSERYRWDHTFASAQVFGSLHAGGEKVDRSRIEYPLPTYLVWGEKWEALPDAFFVDEKEAMVEGRDAQRQIV
jgi:hypothetical protein